MTIAHDDYHSALAELSPEDQRRAREFVRFLNENEGRPLHEWPPRTEKIVALIREVRADVLPPRVLAALDDCGDNAEMCLYRAKCAGKLELDDTREKRIEDAVTVAANGLRALRLLTGSGG